MHSEKKQGAETSAPCLLYFVQPPVVFCFLLLVLPDFHDDAVRYQFYQQHLEFHRQTVDGVILLCFVKILQSRGHAVLCLIEPVEILHLVAVVGLEGMIEELSFDPAGIHGHTADAPGLQFLVHGPGV